jgi:hypothetical protein
MSGVVDSGRESGHGNIDANDPNRSSTDQREGQRMHTSQLNRVRSWLSAGDKVADTRSRPSICPAGDCLVDFLVAANGY